MNKNTEIATKETFALQAMTDDMREMIEEELDGLEDLQFDTVKIPSGGGLAFELPGDDPDNPEMLQELVGVILYHHPVNSYWPGEYSGGNEQPDCVSTDGKVGCVRATGEIRDCKSCPYNQYGSDPRGGSGKACKNGQELFVLRENEILPVRLQLPPTSIKNFKGDYIAKRLLGRGLRSNAVVTRIKLTRDKNAAGIQYSKATFAMVGQLTPEQVQALEPTREAIKALALRTPAFAQAPLDEVVDGSLPF